MQAMQTNMQRSSCRASTQRSVPTAVIPRSMQPVQPPMLNMVPACNISLQHHRVIVRSGKLGDVSLFSESSSSLLGGAMIEEEKNTGKSIDDVPLESEVGMDYTALRDYLKAGEFRKAEDETRALLIRLAGEGAVKRGWVYFTEVKSISVKDFQTMDKLWLASSNGKFGYSVQKEIWNQNQRRWGKFFKQIDWTQGENNVYRKWPMEFDYSMKAPRGHLPLTNALRGTQLFEAILTHPAWEKSASNKKSIDDKAKEAGANTLKF